MSEYGRSQRKAGQNHIIREGRNRKVRCFWSFQEKIIDERGRVLGPDVDMIRDSQAADRDREEEDDQDDQD